MASTAITPTTLEPDAFARKVLEDRLRVTGPYRGYYYASREGVKDDELFRTQAVFVNQWRLHVEVTQDNVAGGTVEINMPGPATGYLMIKNARLYTDGNAAMSITHQTGAANDALIASVGAAAGIYACLPAPGGVSSATGNTIATADFKLMPNGNIEWAVGSIAQTKILRLVGEFLLIGTNVAPTLNTTGSGGTPSAIATTVNSVTEVTTGWPW